MFESLHLFIANEVMKKHEDPDLTTRWRKVMREHVYSESV